MLRSRPYPRAKAASDGERAGSLFLQPVRGSLEALGHGCPNRRFVGGPACPVDMRFFRRALAEATPMEDP